MYSSVYFQGCQGGSDMPESKLITDLLKKYDDLVRPAQRLRQNVTVHFSLALNQIIALDDTSGQLDSRVTLRMVSKFTQESVKSEQTFSFQYFSLICDIKDSFPLTSTKSDYQSFFVCMHIARCAFMSLLGYLDP